MMRPDVWQPPVEPSAAEQQVIGAVRRAKLFVFLRRFRHLLFDEAFQAELAGMYADSDKGRPPVPPAMLALATILQAYTRVGDDEVIEAMVMDRRWQLVLDCLDTERAPFSKGTLVNFRVRLIAANLDRRLIGRSVALAAETKGFGSKALRVALDSSPLWGAGRVEDTINLLGHALRKALGVVAAMQGWGQAEGAAVLAAAAGVPALAVSSLKAALDADWDDPATADAALAQVLGYLDQVEVFLVDSYGAEVAATATATARQVRDQDVEACGAAPTLRRGVAKDRRISVEDEAMRHGRKSRTVRFDGYKRHITRDLDTGLIPAVGITLGDEPEAAVTNDIALDLDAGGYQLGELHIDRAYLSSTMVRQRGEHLQVFCKAWRVRNTTGRYTKTEFTIDFDTGQLTCPAAARPRCRGGAGVVRRYGGPRLGADVDDVDNNRRAGGSPSGWDSSWCAGISCTSSASRFPGGALETHGLADADATPWRVQTVRVTSPPRRWLPVVARQSSSGMATGCGAGRQVPHCSASSTTKPSVRPRAVLRLTARRYGPNLAWSSHNPRPQKRQQPRAAFGQNQQFMDDRLLC